MLQTALISFSMRFLKVSPLKRIRECQVCESAQSKSLFRNKMPKIAGIEMSYTLAKCEACGFAFAVELSSDNDYSRYYRSASKYDSQFQVSEVDATRSRAAVEILVNSGVSRDASILDVGCGFGVFLSALKDAGFTKIRGIDPAPYSSETAKKLFGLDCIVPGDINNISAIEEVDCLSLMAVIEHLPNLRRDLVNLIGRLKLGAYVLVEVPAVDMFDGDRGEPLGELSIEHIQFFSSFSLRNLFESLGLSVVYEKLVELPTVHSGALYMLGKVTRVKGVIKRDESGFMEDYLSSSMPRLMESISFVPAEKFVVYGAGSHTARLLSCLSQAQEESIVTIVDGNRNLQGQCFGKWLVESPENLKKYPCIPVLISSFRAQNAIEAYLNKEFPHNPVIRMYDGA